MVSKLGEEKQRRKGGEGEKKERRKREEGRDEADENEEKID